MVCVVRDITERVEQEERLEEPVDLSATLRSEIDRIDSTYPEVTVETDVPDGVTVRANELLGEVLGNVLAKRSITTIPTGFGSPLPSRRGGGDTVREGGDTGREGGDTVEEGGDTVGPVTVRIADDGRALPDERREAIFGSDETGHAKSTGSGFGLFFVDAMMTEYGGDVRVEDTDPEGATLVLELPVP